MVIYETSVFTRQIQGLISDDDYRQLQGALVVRPDLGAIIPHSGGIRKIRWHLPGRGKRGGIRVIYYWLVSNDQIYMLLAYAKNQQDDLTPNQLATLRKLIAKELDNE